MLSGSSPLPWQASGLSMKGELLVTGESPSGSIPGYLTKFVRSFLVSFSIYGAFSKLNHIKAMLIDVLPLQFNVSSLSTTATSTVLSFTKQGGTTYQYSLNNGSWVNLSADGLVSGLASATTYSIRVRGVNRYGNGPASNTVSVTTQSLAKKPGDNNHAITTYGDTSTSLAYTAFGPTQTYWYLTWLGTEYVSTSVDLIADSSNPMRMLYTSFTEDVKISYITLTGGSWTNGIAGNLVTEVYNGSSWVVAGEYRSNGSAISNQNIIGKRWRVRATGGTYIQATGLRAHF